MEVKAQGQSLHTVEPLAVEPAAHGAALAALAQEAGLGTVDILAWRDLEDPEAGGSELHAASVARVWAAAGISVTVRTSAAEGMPSAVDRDGYRVVRKSGRYAVFARASVTHL
ncbi:MAG TPA: hypothetical protein VKI64_11235, partial [Acidimicrobiales bacterium]|nr:hypothetical protein [Acidimicrobiales bacterium]